MNVALEGHRPDDSAVKLSAIIKGLSQLEATKVEIGPIDLPGILFLASRSSGLRTVIEIVDVGILAQLSNRMKTQGSEALNPFEFAVEQVSHQMLDARWEKGAAAGQVAQVEVHPIAR